MVPRLHSVLATSRADEKVEHVMRVPVITALRAELSRARSQSTEERVALFVLGLADEGDLPAWALACELAPERARRSMDDPTCTMLVGAAPLPRLAHTLHRAGERELSAALRSSDAANVPVVWLDDVVRTVTALSAVEAEEIEALIHETPAGRA